MTANRLGLNPAFGRQIPGLRLSHRLFGNRLFGSYELIKIAERRLRVVARHWAGSLVYSNLKTRSGPTRRPV